MWRIRGAASLLALLAAGCASSVPPAPPLLAATGTCADAACCPAGFEPRVGTAGPDRLRGRSAADCLVGAGGDDRARGRCRGDLLICGEDDDFCQTVEDLPVGGMSFAIRRFAPIP